MLAYPYLVLAGGIAVFAVALSQKSVRQRAKPELILPLLAVGSIGAVQFSDNLGVGLQNTLLGVLMCATVALVLVGLTRFILAARQNLRRRT